MAETVEVGFGIPGDDLAGGVHSDEIVIPLFDAPEGDGHFALAGQIREEGEVRGIQGI